MPYLIIGTKLQQYQEDACSKIKDVFICQNQLRPQDEDCAVTLILEAESRNCKVTYVNVSTPILKSITDYYVLVIPAANRLKVQKLCTNKEIEFIENPSLIQIPVNCGINIGNTHFWNKEDTINGHPFLLPQIKLDTFEQAELQERPIQLSTINLDQIKSLREQSNALKLPKLEVEDIHPATWSFITTIIILIIMALVVFLVSKIIQKKLKTQRKGSRPETQTDETNKSSLLFSTLAGGVMDA